MKTGKELADELGKLSVVAYADNVNPAALFVEIKHKLDEADRLDKAVTRLEIELEARDEDGAGAYHGTRQDWMYRARAAEARVEALVKSASEENDEICQTIGQALGYYPWFRDDQKNFPGATAADGVCVGDHIASTLAMEMVDKYKMLENVRADLLANIALLYKANAETLKALNHLRTEYDQEVISHDIEEKDLKAKVERLKKELAEATFILTGLRK